MLFAVVVLTLRTRRVWRHLMVDDHADGESESEPEKTECEHVGRMRPNDDSVNRQRTRTVSAINSDISAGFNGYLVDAGLGG